MGASAGGDARGITRLLEQAAAREPQAGDTLLAAVYAELKELARARLARERPGHTLQPTALVHEVWLRVFEGEPAFESRAHFYGAVSQAMRRVLVDHARRRSAAKRGGGRDAAALTDAPLIPGAMPEEIVSVHEALLRMEERQPRAAEIVRLRFFAGLEVERIAEVLGLSSRTVRREWSWARAVLYRDLKGGDEA